MKEVQPRVKAWYLSPPASKIAASADSVRCELLLSGARDEGT